MKILDDFREDADSLAPRPLVVFLLCSIGVLALAIASKNIYDHYIFELRNTSMFNCFYSPYKYSLIIGFLGILGLIISLSALYYSKFKLPKSDFLKVLYLSPIFIFILDYFMP